RIIALNTTGGINSARGDARFQLLQPFPSFQPVHVCDVRMVERREQLRLALEADHACRVSEEQLGQDLDRDVAPQLRVVRAIDLAHSAVADGAPNSVRAEPRSG